MEYYYSDIADVRFIRSRKSFSYFIFFLLLIFGVFLGAIYLVHYLVKDDDEFTYAIKYKDGSIREMTFKKDDLRLKTIRDIEARNLFNH